MNVHNSIEKQIQSLLKNKKKRGLIFFIETFEYLGEDAAIRQALKRLSEKNIVVRLARGIYLYPKQDKLLGDVIPEIEEIAQAIAVRDNARITPTGAQALNLLGLSTQVPLNQVYLTDGSPRTVKIGNRSIKFKKTSPKNLSTKGKLSGLTIQALKSIGKDKVTKDQLEKIKQILKKEEPEHLYHDMKLAPSWIKDIFSNLLMYYYE
jgi:hypothetical protein